MGWIRLLAGSALLFCGILIFVIEMYGVFHYKYVLNRMHAAALGDTLGIGCSMVGLMILSGLNFGTMKMALVVLFLWFASPTSSHLVAKLETATNEHLRNHCEIYDNLKELEAEAGKPETGAKKPEAAKPEEQEESK